MTTFEDAIASLRPGQGFVIYGSDLSSIKWDDESIETPTLEEINAELVKLKKQEADQLKALDAQKIEVLNKLGITADELRAALS